MNSVTQAMSVDSVTSRNTLSQRFFNICYLTAISVATLGWLSVFGWMTVSIAKWLLA